MKITIVIPAYNEQKRLPDTLKDIFGYVSNSQNKFEVIIVDDGSTDKTVDIAESYPEIKLVCLDQNKGKGFALKTGVNLATGDYIYICDADLSTPISFLDNFLNKILTTKSDIIIGNRKSGDISVEVSKYRSLLGQFGNLLIRLLLGLRYTDTQCGFKLFSKESKELFQYLTVDRWGYDFELLILAKRRDYKVSELAVEWEEKSGSKVRISSYFNTLKDLILVWWKYR